MQESRLRRETLEKSQGKDASISHLSSVTFFALCEDPEEI